MEPNFRNTVDRTKKIKNNFDDITFMTSDNNKRDAIGKTGHAHNVVAPATLVMHCITRVVEEMGSLSPYCHTVLPLMAITVSKQQSTFPH
jgi:hypothetical protein